MTGNGFDLASGLNIVTTVAVVVGVVFAMVQLQHGARTRRDHAAVDVVRTVQTQEVRQAMATILMLPDNVSPEMIRNDPKLLAAALAVDSACEMWGCLVYENVVDLHMLDRMVGGWVRGSWRKLGGWVEAERLDNRNPNIGEWWQWLYDKIEAEPDPSKALGAHITYRGRCKYSESRMLSEPMQIPGRKKSSAGSVIQPKAKEGLPHVQD